MNTTLSSFLSWILVWSIFSGAVFLATHALARYIQNAAVRHLAWVVAFACTWIFPADAALNLIAQARFAAAQCVIPPAPSSVTMVVLKFLFASWIGGAVLKLGRAMAARCTLNRWRAQSVDYRRRFSGGFFPGVPECMLNHIELRLALYNEPVVPVTWGVRKPVVLFPKSAEHWDSARLTAVLLHEVAHVRRCDNLTQLLSLITCALHWFNPVFWYAAKRMEAESEIAADDFAILRGVKPSSYANELLTLARQLSHTTPRCTFAQTAMVKSFTLEHRLRAIINPSATRGRIQLLSHIPVAMILLCSVLAVALLTPRVSASLHPKASTAPTCLPPLPE